MKVDQDYLKRLLEACQASETPTFNIVDLKASGLEYNDPRFEFHMKISADQHLIERDNGGAGFGLTKSMDGSLSWSVVPLRLTASGHQFIEALENKDVWAAIKRGFRDVSIGTLQAVALKLLDGFVEGKVDQLLR